ncbi:serine hydrolase [Paenibacillus sp. UNC499MF]|uniref:serine hydrolase domain-containing protein n=1 Tax=Paenibacillus sp. UNC499MF TaxID=1502751 RepID=UPI00089FC3A0|nr:serine hydrolase domain-containing protein [Paenibacillus sp. UNC499MF]SEG57364.1 CubicO group peptidase, beta-lactamase class C family [Paenibacillus sp. UNC499MF]
MGYEAAASGASALGLSPEGVIAACRAVDREIAAGVTPGAVLAVVRGDHDLVYAAGYAEPEGREPAAVHDGTLYDCASLTKVAVTLPLVLGLIDEGRLTLDTPAASRLPEFASGGKEEVTVGQLLAHTSGLPPLVNLHASHLTREEMWQTVYRTPLQAKPGTRMAYSDVGYMTLGRIAEEMLGVPLDVAAHDKIFGPLGMTGAGFCPPAERAADIAATEFDASAGVRLHGVVHDENARALGGVSGHAGLFASAGDLVRYARMWLGCGLVPAPAGGPDAAAGTEAPGRRILSRAAALASVRSRTENIPGANRGLGWALKGDPLDASGDWMGPRSFGHTGFTGTSLWVDPERDLAVVLLTNRVYYGRGGTVAALRACVHNAIAGAVVTNERF